MSGIISVRFVADGYVTDPALSKYFTEQSPGSHLKTHSRDENGSIHCPFLVRLCCLWCRIARQSDYNIAPVLSCFFILDFKET